MERIVGNWRLNRMAAEYEADSSEDASPILEELFVDGIAIGGSYGHSEDGDDQFLPASYVKSFASAMPTPRPGGYDPAVDLPRETAALGTEDKITAAFLQRPKPNHVVAPSGESVPSGGSGGGNGGGRAKRPQPASGDGPPRDAPIDQRHVGRFIVYGLTRGEAEFYHSRPGEARAVLLQHVALVVIEQRIPDPLERIDLLQSGKPRPNFAVYGLDDAQGRVLRTFRGSARIALVTFAHAHAGGRIRDRDRRDSDAA